MFKKLWRYKNSLFVQLLSLSLVVMILLSLQIVVSPYLERLEEYDEQTITEGLLFSTIERNLINGVNDFSYLETDDLVNKIKLQNPNFRYYIRVAGKEFAFGGVEKNIPYFSGDYHSKRMSENQEQCLLTSRGLFAYEENHGHGHGIAVYNNCPLYRYYFEIAGIDVIVNDNTDLFWDFIGSIRFSQYQNQIIAWAILIGLSMFVIFNGLRSLRRVITVAQQIDLDSNRQQISKQGLPLEMLPMVSAFNDMLRRLEVSYDKNKFFLAAAAHEIRTPLTIMRLTLEENDVLLLKTEMKQQIGHMSALVENLLRLTKYSNHEELNTQPVELNRLSRKVCASRVPLALDSHVEIEFIACETPVFIEADNALIAAALSNVLDNALSFSTRDSVVTVEVTSQSSIIVVDTGPGISEEFFPHIFEPFNKKPPNRNGHGLGLALVKSIIELHHGSIAYDSVVGEGTRFELKFLPMSV